MIEGMDWRQHYDTLQQLNLALCAHSDRGSIGPQEKQIVEFNNARVLVADAKVESIKEIIPILEKISQLNAPLLIITEDVTGTLSMIQTLRL